MGNTLGSAITRLPWMWFFLGCCASWWTLLELRHQTQWAPSDRLRCQQREVQQSTFWVLWQFPVHWRGNAPQSRSRLDLSQLRTCGKVKKAPVSKDLWPPLIPDWLHVYRSACTNIMLKVLLLIYYYLVTHTHIHTHTHTHTHTHHCDRSPKLSWLTWLPLAVSHVRLKSLKERRSSTPFSSWSLIARTKTYSNHKISHLHGIAKTHEPYLKFIEPMYKYFHGYNFFVMWISSLSCSTFMSGYKNIHYKHIIAPPFVMKCCLASDGKHGTCRA